LREFSGGAGRLKMEDRGKCRTWKMTHQIAGLENAGPQNDGPTLTTIHRAGKCSIPETKIIMKFDI